VAGCEPIELFKHSFNFGHPRLDGFVHGVPLLERHEDSLDIRDDGIVEIF